MLPHRAESDGPLIDDFRLQFCKFLNVAGLAAFTFDYCLTFSTEVEYIWGTSWGLTRIVFTVSRYLPFVSSSMVCYETLVARKCGSFIIALNATFCASIVSAEGILMLRAYALWGRSKIVLILLLLLTVAFIAIAGVLSMLINVSSPEDSTSSYRFYPSACRFRSSRSTALQYAILMVYEIVLQSMNSWRKFRTYRCVCDRLVNSLYWDGIMYMWGIIALSAANMTVQIAAPIAYISALDTAQVAIHSVLASRIFFNLKQCGERTVSGNELELETLRYRSRSMDGAAGQPDTIDIT